MAVCFFSTFELAAQSRNAAEAGEDEPVSLEWVLTESDRSGLGNIRIRRLLAFVDSLKVSEIEPTIHRLTDEQSFGQNSDVRKMLYARWCKSDRDAVLRYLLDLEGDAQHSARSMVLPMWAATEPMKAWQWFEENSEGVRSIAAHSILREIAHSDPVLALKLFSESGKIENSLNKPNPAFLYATWANRDPAAAAAHLDANPMAPFDRASSMMSIVSVWVRKDVDSAWRWAKSISSLEERHRVMEAAISFLAIVDLEQAEKLVEEFPQGKARKSAVNGLVSLLYMEHPEKAFEVIKRHGGATIEDTVLGRWAIRDADAALKAAKAHLPMGPQRQRAFNEIIRNVADHDIDRAIEIFEEFGPGSNLSLGATIIAMKLARQDLAKARRWGESLPDGDIKNGVMAEIASKWVGQAPEDAANYALAQAANDPSKNLLCRTLSRWGSKDPHNCAKWIVAHLEESDQRQHLSSAVDNWAEHDPEGASAWVAALPKGEVRAACFGRLGSQWGYHHPTEGEKWLENLVPGKARDEAISSFSGRIFEYDAEKAMLWSTKIDDPKTRERAIQQTAYKFLRSEPEKAREWIRSSSLSDKLKQSLLSN